MLIVLMLKVNYKEFIRSNRLITKAQQIFRSMNHNIFTGEVKKIALSANDGKRIQSINSTETYAYEASDNLTCKNEEINRSNMIKQ